MIYWYFDRIAECTPCCTFESIFSKAKHRRPLTHSCCGTMATPLERLPPELLLEIALQTANLTALSHLSMVCRRLRRVLWKSTVLRQFLRAHRARMEVRVWISTPPIRRSDELYFGSWLRRVASSGDVGATATASSAASANNTTTTRTTTRTTRVEERPLIIHWRRPWEEDEEQAWIYSFAVDKVGRVQTEKICLDSRGDLQCMEDALQSALSSRQRNAVEDSSSSSSSPSSSSSVLSTSSPAADALAASLQSISFETKLSPVSPGSDDVTLATRKPRYCSVCQGQQEQQHESPTAHRSPLCRPLHTVLVDRHVLKNHRTFFATWNDDHSFTFSTGQRLTVVLDYNRLTSTGPTRRVATMVRSPTSATATATATAIVVGSPPGNGIADGSPTSSNWWFEMDARERNSAQVGHWGWWHRLDVDVETTQHDTYHHHHHHHEGDIRTDAIILNGLELTRAETLLMYRWLNLST